MRDEASNLPRLARCLFEQARPPSAWRIVDNGSTDGTLALAVAFEHAHDWIEAVRVPGERVPRRGGPVVRAMRAGIARLDPVPDIVVKVDADVSMAPNYFERLIAEFAGDPQLGIASGSRHEWDGSTWRQRHVTGTSVEGQCRAYRWDCLVHISPLEERLGWDGLDEMKANVLGWRTRTVRSLPFRHHRRIGARDPSPRRGMAGPRGSQPLHGISTLVRRPPSAASRPP